MLLSFTTLHLPILPPIIFFFFNPTATTDIYTLSLHDALPILTTERRGQPPLSQVCRRSVFCGHRSMTARDRKSTRLNSSHVAISYAVFCLKKKKKNNKRHMV